MRKIWNLNPPLALQEGKLKDWGIVEKLSCYFTQ